MASLFSKLQFKTANNFLLLNAPDEFSPHLSEVETVEVDQQIVDNKTYEFALIFVKTSAEIQEITASVVAQLADDAILWFAYPKKSSKRYKNDSPTH